MTFTSREIILTSSSDSPITAYDPMSSTILACFSGSRSPRKGLALAGNNLIAASHISPDTATSGFIQLYNWWSSAAFHCIHVPEPVAPIVASPNGSYLFAGSISGRVYTFKLPSGDLCGSFQAHRQPVSCFTIDEDCTLLISGADDGNIGVFPILRLLDVSLDKHDSVQHALYQFTAHSSVVTCIALGSGGCNSSIVSSSLDGTCKFWSIADGAHLRTIRFPCPMWCITVDPINSAAYAGGSDGKVYAIPTKRRGRRHGVEVVPWEAEQSGAVMAVAMVNGSKNLVSASEEGIIRIWEVESGSTVRVFEHGRGGTVSDLLVANRFGNGQIKDKAVKCNGASGQGLCAKEIYRKVRDVDEREVWLGVAVKDRRRAIDMLEAAIETYERLLGVLLKEAKGTGDKAEEYKDFNSSL